MWQFSWVLGLSFACLSAILGVIWLKVVGDGSKLQRCKSRNSRGRR